MLDWKIIEKKWQDYWEKNNTFKVDINSSKPKFYVLDMFPYPSGSGLHVGHPRGYTATDIMARYKKLKGFEVLHPMGFDAFGLPAEQYAIQTGNSPDSFTDENIEKFIKQLKSFGFSYDWDRKIVTSKPWYYKHTQWIFAQLHKNGLTEFKEIEVNWSPSLNTVLSNEEVLLNAKGESVSERDGKPVIKKAMKQWVLKITKYADELFNGLENLDWPESVKSLQRNWIYTEDENGKKILHLRDWIFARQRYWGEPFPIIHKTNGEVYLIPETEYPVVLPQMNDYKFSQDGEPALSKATNWLKTELGIRDTNTMPQWAGSCWYYIAFLLKKNDENEIYNLDSKNAKEILEKWLPVDLYVGGQEHAVLHLLYARFWHIFLCKVVGITTKTEPFKKLFNQGMILGPDGSKMSKSKGNVINPDDIISEYGADTLRLYEMFMGPLSDDRPWSSEALAASNSWLQRVWRLFEGTISDKVSPNNMQNFNLMIENVEKNLNDLKFNVFVSDMMIFINGLYKDKDFDKTMLENFLKVLSIICPHIAEELWIKHFKNTSSIYNTTWPTKYNVESKEEEKYLIIQQSGKFRLKYIIPEKIKLDKLWEQQCTTFPTSNEKLNELVQDVLSHNSIKQNFIGKKIVKIIYVHEKILNIISE